MTDETNPVEATFEKIAHCVCTYFDVRLPEIKSPIKKIRVVIPRNVLMYLLLEQTKVGPLRIGRWLEKEHSTISCAASRIARMCNKDSELRKDVNTIRDFILFGDIPFKKKVETVVSSRVEEKTFIRPPAQYSNRNIIEHYENINI